jgi:hypothetical protein
VIIIEESFHLPAHVGAICDYLVIRHAEIQQTVLHQGPRLSAEVVMMPLHRHA